MDVRMPVQEFAMSLNRGTVLGLISLVVDLLEGDAFVTISPPAYGALTETKPSVRSVCRQT